MDDECPTRLDTKVFLEVAAAETWLQDQRSTA